MKSPIAHGRIWSYTVHGRIKKNGLSFPHSRETTQCCMELLEDMVFAIMEVAYENLQGRRDGQRRSFEPEL